MRALFSRRYRRATIFASLFFAANVIPFFAIYTFLPSILEMMHLDENATTELLLNLMLIVGALGGMWATAALPRRTFTIWGFAIVSLALLALAVLPGQWTFVVIAAFVLFALVINALNNLNSVYPPEVMPTEVRGVGVGFATAMSRIASAIGTFFLPVLLSAAGLQWTMAVLAATAVGATILCWGWAPETRDLSLAQAGTATKRERV